MPGTGTTGVDVDYIRSKFVPKENFSYDNGTISAPDFLDANYQRAMQSVVAAGDAKKYGNLPITTLVYDVEQYQTSSVYWIIMAVNGVVSWIGIKDGTAITYADVTPLQTNSQYSNHSLSNPSATLTQIEI